MMKLPMMVAAATLFPVGAMAFEVTGGEAELSYSFLTEDSDLHRTDLGGSVEFGFTPQIGAQLDLGFADFGATGLKTTTVAVHGIYHASEVTSVGLFLGRDRAKVGGSSDGQTFLGVEVGYEGPAFGLEAYYAAVDGGDGSVAGVSGTHDFNEVFSVGVAIDRLDVGDADLTALTLRGDYAVTPTAGLFAEVGNASVGLGATDEDSAFVGLGAKITFGAERGATFGRRSLLGNIPGL